MRQQKLCMWPKKCAVEGTDEKKPATKNCETADTSRTVKEAKLHQSN